MTLQDLGNIGEFVAALGVVVSLIYLAIQVRAGSRLTEENTRALNLSALLATQSNFGRFREWFIQDPRLYEIRERGLGSPQDLDPGDRLIFRDLMSEYLFTTQIIYIQHREGMMYPEGWEGMRLQLREVFGTPGGRAMLVAAGPFLSKDFVAEIQTAPSESDPPD